VADYVLGDIQGCYRSLMALLDTIQYNEQLDRLWSVGDLVNRGPQSLEVLRFFKTLKTPHPPRITLGNHDLYLLVRLFTHQAWPEADQTLDAIDHAPDREDLGHWLRQQSLVIVDSSLQAVMSHAGIPPLWTLEETLMHAQEVEQWLRSDNFIELLHHLAGNQPEIWQNDLQGFDRLRCIVNYLTRMRLVDGRGGLDFSYKGTLHDRPSEWVPWYEAAERKPIAATIVFGHWAALGSGQVAPNVYALDSGCVWGGALTALRLQDKQFFSVESQEC
jgi:bis(5'-nucleosyl)-tetraphosphatase (symmetrical)